MNANGNKDTNIQWLGRIPAHWKLMPNKYIMTKIKEICPVYKDEPILSLSQKGVIARDLDNPFGKMPKTFNGYQKVRKGNLLMCLFDIDVTPRCIGLIESYGLCSPAYSQFKLRDFAHSKYYYYYYLNLDFKKTLLHLAKNLRHSLTEEDLGKILTPVPPLNEQLAIAKFLDSKCAEIDALTSDIEKQIETLQEYKKSVITEAVTKGLDPNVKMQDSGVDWIGNIPNHWTISKLLYQLSQPITDGPHITPVFLDKGIPFISAEAVSSGKIDFSKLRGYISSEFYKLCCRKYTPQINDIYIVKSGATTGVSAIVEEKIKFQIWSPLAALRFNDHKVLPKFALYVIKSNYFLRQIENAWSYGTQQNIGMRVIEKLKIAFPSLDEQQSIIEQLDTTCSQVDSTIDTKQKQLETLAKYKQSLIYEYVTGKKTVPNA